MHLCDHQIPKSHRPSSPAEALQVPEIVLSIQECLSLDTLLVSLQVSRLWYNAGHPLLWRTVHWENIRQKCSETMAIQEQMLLHSHRIRTLHCMFHSQEKISSVDTSVLLNSFVGKVRVSTICLLLRIFFFFLQGPLYVKMLKNSTLCAFIFALSNSHERSGCSDTSARYVSSTFYTLAEEETRATLPQRPLRPSAHPATV